MKALLRGFLAGFGFALGASVAGTLIGYGLGKLGEASVKRLLSPEPTSSPAPSSSQPSSEQPASDDRPCSYCGEHHQGDPRHEVSGDELAPGDELRFRDLDTLWDRWDSETDRQQSFDQWLWDKCGLTRPGNYRRFREQHKSHYDASAPTVYEVHEADSKCGCPMEGFKHGGPHHNADYVAPESRKLIGPPHAHYDAPCTDSCYEPGTVTMPLAPELVSPDYGVDAPGDDEDDGGDYFRALDRHDNAQKAEETETAEKPERDGKQAS